MSPTAAADDSANLERQRLRARLIRLLCRVEHEKARLLQSAWRRRQHGRVQQAAAAAARAVAVRRIQHTFRTRLEALALCGACRAVLQKRQRGMPLPLGLEVCVWLSRFVYLTRGALCHQRMAKSRKSGHAIVDVASTRLVRYADIDKVIGELPTCTLVIRARRRATVHDEDWHAGCTEKHVLHYFVLPSAELTELWACSLARLVTLAGGWCEAHIDLGREEEPPADESPSRQADSLSAAWSAVRASSSDAVAPWPPLQPVHPDALTLDAVADRLSRPGMIERAQQLRV